jgi:ubiquinone/menaquinone biosynthesis C-methylase UbiE
MKTLTDTIHAQFDSRADAYRKSKVHAEGPDLDCAKQLVESLADRKDRRMLDVGCGAGHLAFALAPLFKETIASDPSDGMLAVAGAEAKARMLSGFSTSRCLATSLPFNDGDFDVVGTRYSAHHWNDVPAALREMHRVLNATGNLLVIDILGGADPLTDTHLQAWELMRDPSHVRDYTDGEWKSFLRDAGFKLLHAQTWPARLEFEPWIERMRTPTEAAQAIRRMQQLAPTEVARLTNLEPDGSFTAQTGLYWCCIDQNHRPSFCLST